MATKYTVKEERNKINHKVKYTPYGTHIVWQVQRKKDKAKKKKIKEGVKCEKKVNLLCKNVKLNRKKS
jgi:hypothetical protein